MIKSVDSPRISDQVGQALQGLPAVRKPDSVREPVALRGRSSIAPSDSAPPGSSERIGNRVEDTFSQRVILAIRPHAKTSHGFRPVQLRESLARLQMAIDALGAIQSDPLLKTAHTILGEERLRAELLSQRLQMILEG